MKPILAVSAAVALVVALAYYVNNFSKSADQSAPAESSQMAASPMEPAIGSEIPGTTSATTSSDISLGAASTGRGH